LSFAHQWAMRASIAKHSFNALSTTEESGRASSSTRAKHEISVLSTTIVFSQAQHTTGAKAQIHLLAVSARLALSATLRI